MARDGQIYTPEFNLTSQAPMKEVTIVVPAKEPDLVKSDEAFEF